MQAPTRTPLTAPPQRTPPESSCEGFSADVARAGNCVKDCEGRYVIAPAVEGRIVCLAPLPEGA